MARRRVRCRLQEVERIVGSGTFLSAAAEQERAGTVRAAERLRQAGLPCPVVSVGSTPTALSAQSLDGVTEVRAGVYVFFDLVMHNIGVCATDEIALSVLTTVIGHQEEKGWAIVDAGWMAMSRDRGTGEAEVGFRLWQVCAENGLSINGYIVDSANQKHGIVWLAAPTSRSASTSPWEHACAYFRTTRARRQRSFRSSAHAFRRRCHDVGNASSAGEASPK